MDVKTLCLGLLTAGEACGYDLKKTFESSFKHFFPAGYGSIYPALADLAEAGADFIAFALPTALPPADVAERIAQLAELLAEVNARREAVA